MAALATRDSNARPTFDSNAAENTDKHSMTNVAGGEENKRHGVGMHQQMMGQKMSENSARYVHEYRFLSHSHKSLLGAEGYS